MLTMTHRPIKRLSRPVVPRGFRVTDRDIEILRVAVRFRFLRLGVGREFSWLQFGPHPSALARPLQSWIVGQASAAVPAMAKLGNPAADLRTRPPGCEAPWEMGAPVKQTSIGRARTPRPPRHSSLTRCRWPRRCAHSSTRAAGDARLIDHHELLPLMPAATRELRDPFKLRLQLRSGLSSPLSLAVIPDRLFSVALPDQTRHNFALELDTGSMPITTKRKTERSSYAQKIASYFHAWREQKHTAAWGFKNFRVLTVTSSDARISNMLDAQQSITSGSAPGLFLYSSTRAAWHSTGHSIAGQTAEAKLFRY